MFFAKKCWDFWGQTVQKISLNPISYHLTLDIMSSEQVPFILPVVFTVGPFDPVEKPALFKAYAKKIAFTTPAEMKEMVTGIIHGEIRVYSAKLTVLEMFNDREKFRAHVRGVVEEELNQFGLHIYNANIAEMTDMPDNKYFYNLKQKALETTGNQARIDIAEAMKVGDIGENQRAAEATMRIANIDAERIKEQNLRLEDNERSKLALEMVNLSCDQERALRQVEVDLAPKQRKIERDTELNILQAKNKEADLRATILVTSEIEANARAEEARGDATAQNLLADAALYKAKNDSEAMNRMSDAELYKARLVAEASNISADALAYRAEREAAAILAKATASANGIKYYQECGLTEEMVKFYMSLEAGLFVDLAKTSASAIQGLNPQIHTWTTGTGETGGNDPFATIRNLAMSIPPVYDAIKSQTGISLPGMNSMMGA
jgi:flotillin